MLALIVGDIMSLSKLYKTDTKKEIEGVRFEFGVNEDGTIPTFVVSRTNGRNQRYAKTLEKELRPIRAEMRTGTLENARADRAMMSAFVDGALHGWENIMKSDVTNNKADEGFADFTPDNARALFSNLPELFIELQAKANDINNYREGVEESAKN